GAAQRVHPSGTERAHLRDGGRGRTRAPGNTGSLGGRTRRRDMTSEIETRNAKREKMTGHLSPAHGRGAGGEGFPSAIERLLGEIDRDVARILDRALSGEDISVEEATTLLDA